MKYFLLFFALLLTAHSNTELEKLSNKGIPAKISVAVCEPSGSPVENADVRFSFGYSSDAKSNVVNTHTDVNGMASAQANTNFKIVIQIRKEGYYNSAIEYSVWKNGKGYESGRWEPWNPIQYVTLYKIHSPNTCVRISKKFGGLDSSKTYGYDFLKQKLICCQDTKDISDFQFITKGIFFSQDATINGDWTKEIEFHFSGIGNGIIEKKRNTVSSFEYQYLAPISGYENKVVYYTEKKNTERNVVKPFPSNTNEYLIFRISRETETKEVQFYYGIIDSWSIGKDWRTGEIHFNIRYRFNPEPGNRNIEYN